MQVNFVLQAFYSNKKDWKQVLFTKIKGFTHCFSQNVMYSLEVLLPKLGIHL